VDKDKVEFRKEVEREMRSFVKRMYAIAKERNQHIGDIPELLEVTIDSITTEEAELKVNWINNN
jgi:hypothetical protein